MPDYQKGKIYKLWCPDNDLVYIGSTIQPLYSRFREHKKLAHHNCNSKLLFEACNNVKIELIEEYACNNKMELNKREGEHIRANDCVNKVIPGRTDKEWREDNKDKIKEYCENNRDKIKEQKKEYYKKNKDIINEKRRLKKLQNIEKN